MSDRFPLSIYVENLRKAKKPYMGNELADVVKKSIEEGYDIIKPLQIHRCRHNAGGLVGKKDESMAVIYRTVSDRWALAVDVPTKDPYKGRTADLTKTSRTREEPESIISRLFWSMALVMHGIGRTFTSYFPDDYLCKTLALVNAKDIARPLYSGSDLLTILAQEQEQGFMPVEIVQITYALDNACILLEKEGKRKNSYRAVSRRHELWETAKVRPSSQSF